MTMTMTWQTTLTMVKYVCDFVRLYALNYYTAVVAFCCVVLCNVTSVPISVTTLPPPPPRLLSFSSFSISSLCLIHGFCCYKVCICYTICRMLQDITLFNKKSSQISPLATILSLLPPFLIFSSDTSPLLLFRRWMKMTNL